MSADLRAKLEAMRVRAEGVTPGPWKLWGMSVMADPVGNSNLDDAIDVASTHMTIDGKPRTFDAEFIAHARTDMPRLVTALEAVVGLHQPRTVYANESHCPLQGDHAMGRHVEDRTGFWVCLDSPLTDECQTCTDDNGATADYPCPTVQAITAALTTKEPS